MRLRGCSGSCSADPISVASRRPARAVVLHALVPELGYR